MPQIQFDAVSKSWVETTATLSWNHTIASKPDRMLVLCASIEDNPGPRTCTARFNGVDMPQIANVTAGAGPRNQIFYFQLLESSLPAAAGTYKVDATVSAAPSSGLVVGAMSFWNVGGLDKSSQTTNLTTDAISLTLTPTNPDSWIVSTVCDGNRGTYTPGPNVTETFDQTAGAGFQTGAGGYTSNVGAVATKVDWTYVTGSNRQGMFAAVYYPTTSGVELGTNF